MTRQYACPGCGDILPSIWASIIHCDPNETSDED